MNRFKVKCLHVSLDNRHIEIFVYHKIGEHPSMCWNPKCCKHLPEEDDFGSW